MELAPNIHWIKGINANVYALIEKKGVTLIDTGAESIDKVDFIFNYLERLNLFPLDVKRILVTHADGDHAGNVRGIIDETGATAYASPETKIHLINGSQPKHLSRSRAWFSTVLTGTPAVPEEKIRALDLSNRLLPIMGRLEVIPSPGHTDGHLSFFHPATGVLFAGDALSTRRNQLSCSPDAQSADTGQAARSAIRLIKHSPAIIACGSGAPMSDQSAIDVARALQAWRSEQPK
ncbi:MAG: MBL fold metallo-hydrolase [Chloroflexota bacterium]